MNLKELGSFKLSDAVVFHDELNPKLWHNNNLRPEVKEQLLLIAEDFLSELGIHDVEVKDITVSGSNAAYSYTPHSDLDLHILVDLSRFDDDIYKEFFHAKKALYNEAHDIKIHGIPVEVYVQDSRQPVISLGEYSVLHNKWLRLPTKRRANFDQSNTKAKYETLLQLIQIALKSKDLKKVQKITNKIKQYRQAGLDKAGEFSPENLAYKALRSQGYITKLYDLKDKLHSEVLTIENMYQDPVKVQEEAEIHNYKKLDKILVKLCKMVDDGQNSDKDYGMVGACVLDPDNNIVAGLNSPGVDGKRVHAERIAIEKYERKYGDVPEGSIVITTLSPCNESDDETAQEREGESCTDYLNSKGIEKVYCGYMDPTQDNNNREFNMMETSDKDIRKVCKSFADTFLKQDINEAFDQPYPLKWKTTKLGDPKGKDKRITATTKLPDGEKLEVQFDLSYNGKSSYCKVIFFRGGTIRITGEGDAQRIFATVVSAINEFLSKFMQPDEIVFSANKDVDPGDNPMSRTKLYNRMVQRFAGSYGYNVETKDLGTFTIYDLTKENQGVAEAGTFQYAAEKTPAINPYAGVKDNQFRGSISEAAFPKYVTRIDMTPIEDFESGMKTYYGTDDWHESGLEKKDNFTQEMKGLYAGEPHRTALYASGNASKTRFLELNDPKTGQPVVYFDKKDIPRIRNTKTYVSVFDASRFKKLPTGEYFSENPGKPLKQEEITDPFQYMMNNGWVVRVTDDIQKEFKKAQQLHKAGKIDHYGGENLTEASGYIPSEKEKNDPRFKTALTVDIKPYTMKKGAKQFGWNISRAGIPPTANPNGKF